MEGEQIVGAEAASPAADPGQQPDSSAGTLNTEQQPEAAQPKEQYVPYSRFQQVNQQMRELRGQVAQMQALQQKAQAQQGRLSPEDTQKYREAVTALKDVMGTDDKFRNLLELADLLPQLKEAMQLGQSLRVSEERRQVSGGSSYIKTLAEKANMPTDNPAFLNHLVSMVAREAQQLENGPERFDAGDMTVLDEAFKKVQTGVFGGFVRQAGNKLINQKQQTAALPPASRGGFAGKPAPAKLEPGKEREFVRDANQRAASLLESLLGG